MKLSWSHSEIDAHLSRIMKEIHDACVKFGLRTDGSVDYLRGANVSGFLKIAGAMVDHGVI